MVATKKRPVQSLYEAVIDLKSNPNYIYEFLYFNFVNLVGIYNGEIEKFTSPYKYNLF